MTIFKSRQVNLDPAPYFGLAWQTRHAQVPVGAEHDTIFDPRPEFEATRDPYPWESSETNSVNGKHRAPAGYSDNGRGLFVWAPRREQFDTPVNRILEEFRRVWRGQPDLLEQAEYLARELWDAGHDGPDFWTRRYPFEEIDHARRVLTRLARRYAQEAP